MNDKFCPKCKTRKPIEEFYLRGTNEKGYHYTCKECMKEYYRQKWNNVSYEEKLNRRKISYDVYHKVRNDVIKEYGGKCVCCGETRVEFLSVDHIQGGGTKHRKTLGGGSSFFYWLRRNNFPKDNYRLLCMNCNWARGRYGYCPHEKERGI